MIGGHFSDRFGISAIITLETIAIPIVASLGALGGIPGLLLPMCFLAGCFAFGAHTCLHGIAGSLYPTPVRANGVGWGNGIAKIGSIAGPFIGGFLLPNLSSQGLFLRHESACRRRLPGIRFASGCLNGAFSGKPACGVTDLPMILACCVEASVALPR